MADFGDLNLGLDGEKRAGVSVKVLHFYSEKTFKNSRGVLVRC